MVGGPHHGSPEREGAAHTGVVASPGAGTALLIIDMQVAVVRGSPDLGAVVERINQLQRRARAAGAPVVYIQHHDAEGELVRGEPDWELVAGLDRSAGTVVAKTYLDRFAGTELLAVLAAHGTTRLVLTGAASNYCVYTTALSAVARGFAVTLARDAHLTDDTSVADASGAALPAAAVSQFINDEVARLDGPGRLVEVVPATEVRF